MESPAPGPGLVERLAQLATCPLCGGPFEDPVLLACEHSFCRACLARRWGAPGPEAAPACPRCGQPCPRRSLRSHVRLAVEVRISRGLRERLAEPGARARRRRGGRIPTMGSLDPPGEVRRRGRCGRSSGARGSGVAGGTVPAAPQPSRRRGKGWSGEKGRKAGRGGTRLPRRGGDAGPSPRGAGGARGACPEGAEPEGGGEGADPKAPPPARRSQAGLFVAVAQAPPRPRAGRRVWKNCPWGLVPAWSAPAAKPWGLAPPL